MGDMRRVWHTAPRPLLVALLVIATASMPLHAASMPVAQRVDGERLESVAPDEPMKSAGHVAPDEGETNHTHQPGVDGISCCCPICYVAITSMAFAALPLEQPGLSHLSWPALPDTQNCPDGIFRPPKHD
jgi:hypothetical protein